jgi:hypothetical protein
MLSHNSRGAYSSSRQHLGFPQGRRIENPDRIKKHTASEIEQEQEEQKDLPIK